MKKKWLVPFIVVFLGGCATWSMVASPAPFRYDKLELQMPEGWMRMRTVDGTLLVTKDGELLQNIRLFRLRMENEKTLPLTKKKLGGTMLPQEIADALLAELNMDSGHFNFTVVTNEPATVGGKDGFTYTYSFTNKDKLKIKTSVYGIALEKYVYILQYRAAAQYYFDKDKSAFEQVARSLSLRN